jgi:hypothetical protein
VERRHPVTGGGEYRISEVVAPEQQMKLDLLVDGVSQHFDSGVVPPARPSPTSTSPWRWPRSLLGLGVRAGGAQERQRRHPIRPAQPVALLNPFQDVMRVAFDLPRKGAVDLRTTT